MNEQLVFHNGSIVPLSQARVSVLDGGFLYGDGLFETMRSYRGRVFALDRHLDRLSRGMEELGIPFPDRLEFISGDIEALLRANSLLEVDARVRLTVSAGEGSGTPQPERNSRPTVVITATKLSLPDPPDFDKGYRAVVSAAIRRNHLSPLSRLKTLNYLENLLARKEAKSKGVEESILLNAAGGIAEGTVSNVFIVIDGKLLTPSLDSGILPGITRQVVIGLATGMGIPVEERWIYPEELGKAEECFLTNSVIELMPLVEIDGRPIGNGKPGPFTRQLAVLYRKMASG